MTTRFISIALVLAISPMHAHAQRSGPAAAAKPWSDAADMFNKQMNSYSDDVAQQRQSQGSFDGVSTVRRDSNGNIQPIELLDPTTYYGESYNKSAVPTYIKAVITEASNNYTIKQAENPRDVDGFDQYTRSYNDRAVTSATPQLRGMIREELYQLSQRYLTNMRVQLIREKQRDDAKADTTKTQKTKSQAPTVLTPK